MLKSLSSNSSDGVLTHSHTMTPLGKKPFENIVGKEKLLVQAISPFPTMFSTLSKTEIIIFVTFNLLSANAFSLVLSKILLAGNGLRKEIGVEESTGVRKTHKN